MIDEFLNLWRNDEYCGYYYQVCQTPRAEPDAQEIFPETNVNGNEGKGNNAGSDNSHNECEGDFIFHGFDF
jgi:hypothetical protein